MTSSEESLLRLLSKVQRAKKHVADLQDFRDSFLKDGAYEVGFEDDLDTGQRSYYLKSAKEIAPQFTLIVGDAIHNLRCALDHLAYHLVWVGTNSAGPFDHVYFPIFESFEKYKSPKVGKFKGMRQDAIDAIETVEPYKGGVGEILWHLHCLDNIDKHRLLIAVWAYLRAHTSLPSPRVPSSAFAEDPPVGTAQILRGPFVPPTRAPFPLKAGEIFLTIPQSEVEKDMKLLLDIAFGHPQIVEGKPIIDTLVEMSDFIHRMIFRFERLGLLA